MPTETSDEGMWPDNRAILTTLKKGSGVNFDTAEHLNEQLADLSTVQFAQRWLSTP